MKFICERFVTAQNQDKEEKKKYFSQVISVLESSYKPIGGLVSLENKEEILDDKYIWKLVVREGKVTACMLYKGNMKDRKLALGGSDGTPEGKKDLYKIMEEDIKDIDRGVWGETSGAIEHIYLDKLNGPAIPSDVAVAIMHSLNKADAKETGDGKHYTRTIGKSGVHTKQMVGYPPDVSKMDVKTDK